VFRCGCSVATLELSLSRTLWRGVPQSVRERECLSEIRRASFNIRTYVLSRGAMPVPSVIATLGKADFNHIISRVSKCIKLKEKDLI